MIFSFSSRLKQLRKSKNLRQAQVARLIGVNKSAISSYENNLRQPSFDILVSLANLFSVSTDYLLGQTNIRSIDLTGLTEEDTVLVCELVASMSQKNAKLNNL
ncbi:MAG: helix-turn-helix transcriptional regulator [Oscillospiraceae bacterium]|nr:helix-turn-helix transcriptional regulator [Oscillospiraceae bacterium]